jgi:uncharacterized protein YjbJ (UPF0337 family)
MPAAIRRKRQKGNHQMGARDKASNKMDDVGGKANVAVGKLTDDKSTENQRKIDQAKWRLKGAGEKVKDTFKE